MAAVVVAIAHKHTFRFKQQSILSSRAGFTYHPQLQLRLPNPHRYLLSHSKHILGKLHYGEYGRTVRAVTTTLTTI